MSFRRVAPLARIRRRGGASPPFRVLFLGDVHFGESYSRAGAVELQERGYRSGLEALEPFIAKSDFTIVNLETPLLDPTATASPHQGVKRYLHWADPDATPRTLTEAGVDAAGLANNHMLDYGQDGLLSTLRALGDHGIRHFGAGANIAEALEPLEVPLPTTLGPASLAIHGSFQRLAAYEEYGFYAEDGRPGVAPLVEPPVGGSGAAAERSGQLRVAFPHWGPNYRWRSRRQRELGDALLRADFDVIVGHGAHCLQQIELRRGRWIAYGIGNGVFHSGGRYAQSEAEHGILPFSLWTMLHVVRHSRSLDVSLRCYPVYSDNRTTGFRPKPVSEPDFFAVVTALRGRARPEERFDNEHRSIGQDDLGRYVRVRLGRWDATESLPRVPDPPALATGSSQVQESRDRVARPLAGEGRGASTRDEIVESPSADTAAWGHYRLASQLIAVEMIRRGYEVTWLDREWFVGEVDGVVYSFDLTNSHRTSTVGARAGKRKDITNLLLRRAGVQVPEGRAFGDDERVEARDFAACLGVPTVVKPASGTKGRGVSVGVLPGAEFDRAFELARSANRRYRKVLVEQQFLGTEARFLVVGGRCAAVLGRKPPQVVGDGVHTIAELIEEKNAARMTNPSLYNEQYKYLISIDDAREARLREQGYGLHDCPPPGTVLVIDHRAGLSTGADSVDLTDVVHPSYLETAVRANRALPGMDVAGIDILARDFQVPAEPGNHVVIDVNTRPGIAGHHFPVLGSPRDVAAAIVDHCVEGRSWDDRLPAPPSEPSH